MATRSLSLNSPDVVVVGAGTAGCVVARDLARAGLGVVVLEAGGWHDRRREFGGLEWESANPFDGVLRWGPRDRTARAWPRVRDGIGPLLGVAGVGGTSLVSGGASPRAHVGAIERAWPIRYEDLVPHYYAIEDALPVAAPDEAWPKDELFIRGCEASTITHLAGPDVRTSGWRMQPTAVLPPGSGAFGGCTRCGECWTGCPTPDGGPLEATPKRDASVVFATEALRTGRCEFRTDVFATQVLTEDRDGRPYARSVRYRDGAGRVFEQSARAIVLAAGAIESPRLWLASGLPDGGCAGRYLTTHWPDFVSGVFARDIEMAAGHVSMSRADFPGYGAIFPVGLGPLAFALATSFGPRAVRGAGPWALAGRTWGSALKRRMEDYGRSVVLAVSVDDDPVFENGVSLAGDVADENNRAPLVSYRPTGATARRREWLARRAAEILIAAGADPESIHRADAPPIGAHLHGTMRMGLDPESSVVDADGEAHAVGRLFVSDTSVFPNALGGADPSLTAQALAARIATRVLARYFSS